MHNPKSPLFLFIAVLVAVVLSNAGISRAAEITHKRFIGEFARFVQGVVDNEPLMRQKMSAFARKNRAALQDGFGSHPEIFPEMFRDAGIEKLNCISGRYYTYFDTALNNEEKFAFYDTKQDLTHWVTMVAYEEAFRLGIMKSPYALSFRRQGDIPEYIAGHIRSEIKPYLYERPGGEDAKGMGFDTMECGE